MNLHRLLSAAAVRCDKSGYKGYMLEVDGLSDDPPNFGMWSTNLRERGPVWAVYSEGRARFHTDSHSWADGGNIAKCLEDMMRWEQNSLGGPDEQRA